MDALDYKALSFWFSVFTFVLTTILAIYVFIFNRQRATMSHITALDGRVTAVEQALKHAPDHGDLAAVYKEINGTNKELSKVVGELSAIRVQLNNVLQHLIKQG